MQKRIVTVVQVLVLVAIVTWLALSFKRENWEALQRQDKDWLVLAIAFGVVLAGHVVSYLRWMILVRALGVPLSIAEALRLGFLGHLFSLVAAGSVGGDLFKAIAVAKRRETKRPEVIASVLMDRAIGLLGLIILACLCLGLLPTHPLTDTLLVIRNGAWVCLAIGGTVLGLIVVAGRNLPLVWLRKIPFVGHALYRMSHSGLIFYGRPGLVFVLIGLSLAVQASLTYGTFLISQALYDAPPSLQVHFQVIPPSFVAGAIPLAPGGMGQMEIAVHELFRKIPETTSEFSGFIVALIYRIMTILVAGIGAIYFFLGFGKHDSPQEPISRQVPLAK